MLRDEDISRQALGISPDVFLADLEECLAFTLSTGALCTRSLIPLSLQCENEMCFPFDTTKIVCVRIYFLVLETVVELRNYCILKAKVY